MRDSPVTKVTVGGVETAFDVDGRIVSVPLDASSERTKIEVE
jgi:hypothetical protein